MAQSIADLISNINKNISKPTVVSGVTPRNDIKLHSADIAYLKVVQFFTLRGKNQKCHLTKEDWQDWLERFGGKRSAYRTQKTRWAKMRALGYVVTSRHHKNMNKEYDHAITPAGLEALRKASDKVSEKANRKALCIAKNSPSKTEKQPLENGKTAPPLNVRINEDKKEKEFYSFDERKQIIERSRQQRKVFDEARTP